MLCSLPFVPENLGLWAFFFEATLSSCASETPLEQGAVNAAPSRVDLRPRQLRVESTSYPRLPVKTA